MGKDEIEKVTRQYMQDPVTMKIERVAAYVRVSTQEQKLHGLSLDAQKLKLIEYAEKNHMKIVEWYIDEGVSGRKLIRNRPELQRMIQDAEKKKFDRIIFIKLDRFFRSVAEYHECMKRISPVIWSTTEEEYDLTTANGRMLVNMKLTIAEMEADMAGERIDIVNEYKVQTGQPLSGSQPFCLKIAKDENTGRKKIIRNPETIEIMDDLIQHFLTFQSKHKSLLYIKAKYHISLSYNALSTLLKDERLCGAYRGNPNYCEAHITKETFDRIQDILSKNLKHNEEQRTYLFSGLIKCPECGRVLAGGVHTYKRKDGSYYRLKKYRCYHHRTDGACPFIKVVSENVLERMLLKNISTYLEDAKIRSVEIHDTDEVKVPTYDIDDIHEQIDRLNYSWKTGKIRKVEQYEKDYEELMEKLALAEAERTEVVIKDFSKIEAILSEGWQSIYENLDEAHRQAFWRSFVQSIEINWTTETKEIVRVNFY